MAPYQVTRLASVTARDGVDTRNKENSERPCEGARGDSLPVDLITGVAVDVVWGDLMIGYERPVFGEIPREECSAEQVSFSLWCDMVDEPAKYGDDICDWLELDAEMRASDKRWRVAAYWSLYEEREQADERRAAIALAEEQKIWRAIFNSVAKTAAREGHKRWVARDIKAFVARIRNAVVAIQSVYRGYRARSRADCCMCLAHTHSPHKTDVGYMCDACRADGPYTDVVPNDPWNWFRC
jgi:hypothetical protein